MTPDEQIIALGTLDGYTDIHGGDTGAYWRGTKGGRYVPLPDYDSLDVMHRMVKAMLSAHPHNRSVYRRLLIDASHDSEDTFKHYGMATAAQHREALLRTLNLWKTPQ